MSLYLFVDRLQPNDIFEMKNWTHNQRKYLERKCRKLGMNIQIAAARDGKYRGIRIS